MTVNLRRLEYLVAVAELLHFGRAAARCHVSQPALSVQIQKLEAELGLRLFERDQQSVAVTGAGAALVEEARRVLEAAERFQARARMLGDPMAGPLRLGVIPTIAPYLLPRALPAVAEAFPKLELFLREDQTSRLLTALQRGELDGVLLAREAELGPLEQRELFRDRFLLAMPAGHPLSGKAQVSPAALRTERVMVLEEGHCLGDQARQVCRLGGRSDAPEVRGSSLTTLLEMVAGGLGLTVLPELAASLHVDGRIALARFDEPEPYRTIILGWRLGSPVAEALDALAPHFERCAPRSSS